MRRATPSPPALSSGHGDAGAVPELRPREEVAADFCLRALRTGEVASLLDDAVATAAQVVGCELVRVVELRDEGDEVVVAVSGVGERAQVFVEGAGTGVEVPIPGRTRPFGVLGAYSKTSRFPPADVGFLQILAITTGHAVERLRREQPPTSGTASPGTDSVAHDLSNLLAVIAGNVELLLDQYDAGGQPSTELEAIEHAVGRAAALLQRFLSSAAPAARRTGRSAPGAGTGQAVDP
ncbi:MAG TPA: hypothetical protein VG795_11255 [Acidimicrobiia bacterium]|nr:hypothetical protein [Acidimicrobiia bacterium]